MSRNLDQGIQAIRDGNHDEGARLLKFALKDAQLPGNLRAVALLWLAETNPDPKFKIEHYRLANKADPTNQDVSQRLSYWLSKDVPSQNPRTDTGTLQASSLGQGGNIQPDLGAYRQNQTDRPIQPQQGQYSGGQPSNPQQPQQQPNPFYDTSGQTSGWIPAQQNPPQQAQQQPVQGQQGYPPQQQPNPFYDTSGQTSGWIPAQQNPPQQQPIQGGQQPNPFYDVTHQTSGMMPAVQDSSVSRGDTGRYGVAPPIVLQQVQRTVGILDGPNGRGTGFFVTRSGLVATTRYVVGGERMVRVELLDKRVVEGTVVRSFPAFDIALIQVNVQLHHLLSMNQDTLLQDNAQIVGVAHGEKALRSTKRATHHEAPPFWFPTVINRLFDAGGDPVFTMSDNRLVGMLTKNSSRSNGFMYGIYINKIYQCVEAYQNELRSIHPPAEYCPGCGIISRAPSIGGHYCENCGQTLPTSIEKKRFPQSHLASLYGETKHQPCPNCKSQVGFYKNECLRCGFGL